ASTAFVQAVVTALNNALALKAPLASPDLTGTPTAPTAAQTVNNTQVATTAFVKSAIAALVASSPAALDTLNELAEALGNDPNFATTMTNALAGKQPLDATLTSLSGKSISGLLQYLQLGEAAKRDVGTGDGQIPDMSAWSLPNGGVGMPNGINFRYGYVSSTGDKTFSTPFPNQCFGIVFGQTYVETYWLFGPMFRENSVNKNGFTFMDITWAGHPGDSAMEASERVFYIAIGN
ncbi:hypothetical protein OGY02_24720, partial [Citrobacter sp. Cpo150]|nr:hypothetical protein [Citrobacter sp. Cpo150]